MAKRRGNSSAYVSGIANRRLLEQINTILNPRRRPFVPILGTRIAMAPVTDRRRYHPAPIFRPIMVSGVRHHALAAGRRTSLYKNLPSPIVRFEAPKKVAICVRRKARREVLFAQRRTGKGAARTQRRRNEYSGISCK